ncbi:MAG: cation:proton antiporter [Chloroflexota bacterium]
MIPPPILAANPDIAPFFIEMGVIFLLLAIAGRLAGKIGLSPIPLYLIVGLLFSSGGPFPLAVSKDFIELGAEIGVLLLLFALGLEYSPKEIGAVLKNGIPAGGLDLLLNFLPGLLFGLLLGMDWRIAMLLGGVTYISSSGIISKLLVDLGWMGNRETPTVLSILVMEDLVMAAYLPLMAVLLAGSDFTSGMASLGVALLAVVVIMGISMRFGERISKVIAVHSNEILLLTVFGLILLTAGLGQQLQVSAAVGAFLVGIAISDPIQERSHHLIEPLKDMFAAIFFVFFGLQINPADIPPVFLLALLLGVITAVTKIISAMWAANRAGIAARGQQRSAALLITRGEFSIVIAGLAATATIDEPLLAPLAAAYVLIMAMSGPILARYIKPISVALEKRNINLSFSSRKRDTIVTPSVNPIDGAGD